MQTCERINFGLMHCRYVTKQNFMTALKNYYKAKNQTIFMFTVILFKSSNL